MISSSDGVGDAVGADSARYAAFISYSHVDERLANQLHRRLESYKLPPKVRGDDGSPRLGKCFRDRADLAAASSLTTAIRSALAQSAALVVLCSPEAKQSQWVDAEIRLFRELKPDAPILAVILRGEPSDGMPAALTEEGREPLAADFRRDADGTKLGFLKVVAALKGVPLDSLIQRDAQRRLRRVTGVTVAAVLLLVVMATMTFLAVSAQREAERQRAEAEGLIEYMLTDLREGLRGVGRIELMNAVNDRAFEYYEDQGETADLSDDSLERRARVMLAMGEDEFNRADPDQAARLFAEAYADTRAALERQPYNPDRIFAHAQSEYWVGRAARARDDAAEHERAIRAYAALAARLTAVQPGLRALRETGYAEGNLCSLTLRNPAQLEEAVQHCERALAAQRRVRAMLPEDRNASIDVANRLSWLADAVARRGNVRTALGHSAEAETIVRALLQEDSANKDTQDLLFAVLYGRGRLLIRAGLHAEADAPLNEAASIVAGLQAVDPANARWRRMAQDVRDLRSN